MPDIQDYYLGQIVTEGEMDAIYTDMAAAERNLAKEANLGQGPVANGTQSGGILTGLAVSKYSATIVTVTSGAARDSNGKRIALPANATVSLEYLGDTPEGDVSSAQGDSSLTASSIVAGEAWVSLFIAFDTNLSDSRVDSLNNTINFRQAESFHFNIEVGTDSAPKASSRPSLNDNKVLLADILLDNNGEIKEFTTLSTPPVPDTPAICGTSLELADIGYGIDDTPALAGRRSDWVALDPDGTDLELWHNASDTSKPNNKAYFNVRGGDPRQMMLDVMQAFNTPGNASTVAGAELIGGKATTGSTRSAPAGSALDLAADASVHDHLVQLKNKINTLMSRGDETYSGTMTLDDTGDVLVVSNGGNIVITSGKLQMSAISLLECEGIATFNDVIVEGKLECQPSSSSLDKFILDARNKAPQDSVCDILAEDTNIVRRVDTFGMLRANRRLHHDFSRYPKTTALGVNWKTDPPKDFAVNGSGTYDITADGTGGAIKLESGGTLGDYAALVSGGGYASLIPYPIYFYARVHTPLLDPLTDMQFFIGLSDDPTVSAFYGLSSGVAYGLIYDQAANANWNMWSKKGALEAYDDSSVTVAVNTTYEIYIRFEQYAVAPTNRFSYWITGMSTWNTLETDNGPDGNDMYGLSAYIYTTGASSAHSMYLLEAETVAISPALV